MKFDKFKTPSNLLRPTPFWAINDRITPEETARQLADIREKGMGGGFFHSRAGLITDYLGKEWFESMDAALKVAEATDGYLWLYDEDLWPSGNAGGQVAALGQEYRQAYLEAVLLPDGKVIDRPGESEILRVYQLKKRNGFTLEEFDDKGQIDPAKVNGDRLVIRRRLDPKSNTWSGQSYANLLNPDVTEKFIDLTHEVYRKRLGQHFGKRIPGMFTDEPQLSEHGFPWYGKLPELYKTRFGRDFWKDIPFSFLNGANHRLIRQSLHRLVIEQFVAAYSRPLYEWCDKNKLAHTGHYMFEEHFATQILYHGGSIMAHYRCQHIPGVDHLIRTTESMFLTLKQVSSAVRQLGAPYALNELFGVSHHTNTFEDFRWIGDYSMVQGAVFFCPHLTWYSMRGKRKRDYPPNWNYQQSYWEHLRPLNDYFARLANALSSGRSGADILILTSIEDAMAELRRSMNTRLCGIAQNTRDSSKANWLESMLLRAMYAVQDAGYDFDLGEESYMADLGRIEKTNFHIGKSSYKMVIVPPAQSWRTSTFQLLSAFAQAGGKVLVLGGLPQELDCKEARLAWEKFAALDTVSLAPCGDTEIGPAVHSAYNGSYKLTLDNGLPCRGVKVHHRLDGVQQFFFVVNVDRKSGRSLRLRLRGENQTVTEWDALQGEQISLSAYAQSNETVCEFTLPPAGSILLSIQKAPQSKSLKAKPKSCGIVSARHDLSAKWSFVRSEENVLVLDRLSYSLDNGKTWSKPDLDSRIRRSIAAHFEIQDSLGWQPWVAIRRKLFDNKGGPVLLRYCFDSSIARPKKAAVVIEDLQKGSLWVNGHSVETQSCPWHWDRGFGKVEVGNLIQKGQNEIVFKLAYDFLSEVEPAYVVGDFGVRLLSTQSGELCKEPITLRNGSWTGQGYPFYSGSMRYCTEWNRPSRPGSRFFLRLLDPSCTLATVVVNSKHLPAILWQPWEIEITSFLKPGKNSLQIELVSSRQNSHGPLHLKEGDSLLWIEPNTFDNESALCDNFALFDYGLLGGAEIVEKRP